MKVKIEAFETYPAGVYPVTVRELTMDADNKYGAQLRWKFELGGALQGKTLTGWCHQSGSVKSKFFEWYAALTGTTPTAGDEVDTDLLIGRTALAVIKVKPKEDGTTKNVIDSLLPATNGAIPPPAARPIFENFKAAAVYAAVHGIGEDNFKAFLKAKGLTTFLGTRDSELVYKFVEDEIAARSAEPL